MNDLLYNAEGYKDETAYKAILQAERGSENMNGYEINKSEIWEERRLHEDLAAASKEAEIYKGLYEQLLARALG